MRASQPFLWTVAWMLAGIAGCASANDLACHAGAYRLDDGSVVDVAARDDDDALRWRLLDGRTGRLTRGADGAWTSTLGWTNRNDGVQVDFGQCAAEQIRFDGQAGKKLAFDVIDTRFAGEGVSLRGRLVLPRGSGPVPIVVEVHGSEHNSAVRGNHRQYRFPAHGIGVFVYDKRGTGESSGRYTQDFDVLAGDATAAMAEARRLAGARAGRVGFEGGSQGGWIAPLAANRSRADFVVVGFGLAESPLAEDREQVILDLATAGYTGPDVLAKAREITDATGAVVASGYRDGFKRLDEVRALYRNEPWYAAMRGEFTGEVLRYRNWMLRIVGPVRDPGTSWDYDPMPTLRGVQAPQLWVLAGADREAPSIETQRRLLSLRAEGRPITTVTFANTDHGILEFETDAQGQRSETRFADGYYRLLVDWIHNNTLAPPYGKALWPATTDSAADAAAGAAASR